MPIPPNEDHLHLRHWNGFFRFPGNAPIAIVNTANTIVWRWENSHAFGANLPEEDPDDNAQLFEYHPGFPGQYFDKETNLHYNYFRYYEPETGRYISLDPIGLAGGINVCGYVEQNPLSLIDPTGEKSTVINIVKKALEKSNIKVDGLSLGLAHGNGRVFGVRHKNNNRFRLDYQPIPGINGESRLHCHIGNND